VKRTHEAVLQAILKALDDGKLHAYGELERKANTNWRTIRDHCRALEFFEAIELRENKVIITEIGKKVLSKLNDKNRTSTKRFQRKI